MIIFPVSVNLMLECARHIVTMIYPLFGNIPIIIPISISNDNN